MTGQSRENFEDNNDRDLDLLIVVFLLFLICVVFTLFHAREPAMLSIFEESSPSREASADID